MKVVEEVVWVVEVARVVLELATLDDTELEAGADVGDDEPLADVEATVDDATDEGAEELATVADEEGADDDNADDDNAPCEELDVETETGAVVEDDEKAVAVVIIEALFCATATGFSVYMLSRFPLPQISELLPAHFMEQSLWRVALAAAGLSVEPHQHSRPYSTPA